jgi:hypothetical protein
MNLSDLTGFFFSIYTDLLGPLWWGFFTLFILIPARNRVNILALVIVGMFMWGTFLVVLPGGAISLGYAILKISLGLAVALLFLGWSRGRGF